MISYRLKSLVKYIDKDDKVIDIGCDHALLDIYLIKEKIIDKIIVSDIHGYALKAGIDNINKYGLQKHIDPRLGNGLEVINENDNIDTLLISGMGTKTILSILDNENINKIEKMIIQSNNDHSILRSELVKKGYYIDKEEYFIDSKKNYINIVFKKGTKKYSKLEIKYGPILIKDKNYLDFEINNINKIYNLIPKNKKLLKYRLKREEKLLNKLKKS